MRRRSLVALAGAVAALVPGGMVATAAASGGAAAASVPVAIYHHPRIPGKTISNDVQYSTNWSGYAVEGSQFNDVSATWAQPSATCSRSTTYASFWVGIDGYSSNSVEQIGTDSDCSSGKARYYAWYEMYPAASVTLSTSTYPVFSGDTLTATVARSGSSYTLKLQSINRGWTYTSQISGSDANSSAEVIAEAPEICSWIFCRVASLTNFGTVNFTGAEAGTTTVSPTNLGSFTTNGGPHDLIMVNNSGTTIKAQPSGLTSSGSSSSFGDTWKHS